MASAAGSAVQKPALHTLAAWPRLHHEACLQLQYSSPEQLPHCMSRLNSPNKGQSAIIPTAAAGQALRRAHSTAGHPIALANARAALEIPYPHIGVQSSTSCSSSPQAGELPAVHQLLSHHRDAPHSMKSMLRQSGGSIGQHQLLRGHDCSQRRCSSSSSRSSNVASGEAAVEASNPTPAPLVPQPAMGTVQAPMAVQAVLSPQQVYDKVAHDAHSAQTPAMITFMKVCLSNQTDDSATAGRSHQIWPAGRPLLTRRACCCLGRIGSETSSGFPVASPALFPWIAVYVGGAHAGNGGGGGYALSRSL